MSSRLVALALAVALVLALGVQAQNGCLRLLGSVACPGFSYAYLSPGNLSNAFPFFSTVTDVASFDAAALAYFSNPYQFQTTKFQDQLGCSNASGAVIRWERTVLCSQWVNEMWSLDCTALYDSQSAATSMKMVCQDTCLQYSASEKQIVNDTSFCPGADLTNGSRATQLEKDFVDCTNWTTLATNDSASCVAGSDNEGSCGFGSSTTQLCDFCKGDSPDQCCYNSNTDISVCGFALPAQSSSQTATGSAATASNTNSLQQGNATVGSTNLSGGQLAGIIVGSVLGGLLLLGLLAFLLLRLRRKRRQANRQSTSSSFAAGPSATGAGAGAGMLGGLFAGKHANASHNNSEKGLLGHQGSMAAGSSPTMGGDTLYSGNGHGRSAEGSVGAGAGAFAGFAAGGAGANMPGERTSAVLLPRVRDENQGGQRWIETGAEVSVLWPYQASLPDELDLRPGMKLRVLRLYDDAWGTAQIISGGSEAENGRQGAFPIVCVSEGSSLGSSAPSSSASH